MGKKYQMGTPTDYFEKILETEVRGLKVKLFKYDVDSEDSISRIKEYLINKVKKSKVHNAEEYNLAYYGTRNLDPEFVSRFNEQVARINIPKKSKIPQFDVRRERVTEWIAQYLLEHVYGCTFYDEADKRINLRAVEIDKHTDGIDVPGIWVDKNSIRFVVCEVKASEETKIPCGSMQSLQVDIQKAIDDTDNRVSREILEYIHGIRNVEMQDELLDKIVRFLENLIAGEKKDLADSIMFFPVVLRNNEKIVLDGNVDDYKNFSLQRVKRENVENIILEFEKQFAKFSNEIYDKAIGE